MESRRVQVTLTGPGGAAPNLLRPGLRHQVLRDTYAAYRAQGMTGVEMADALGISVQAGGFEQAKMDLELELGRQLEALLRERMASKKQTKLGTAIKLARLLLSALQAYQEAKPHINSIRKKKKK